MLLELSDQINTICNFREKSERSFSMIFLRNEILKLLNSYQRLIYIVGVVPYSSYDGARLCYDW